MVVVVSGESRWCGLEQILHKTKDLVRRFGSCLEAANYRPKVGRVDHLIPEARRSIQTQGETLCYVRSGLIKLVLIELGDYMQNNRSADKVIVLEFVSLEASR